MSVYDTVSDRLSLTLSPYHLFSKRMDWSVHERKNFAVQTEYLDKIMSGFYIVILILSVNFTMMISRAIQPAIIELMSEYPAIGILGPRQVGKTTLAKEIAKSIPGGAIYLDLESPTDRAKLHEPEIYFSFHKGRLIILDEIQRVPELFQVLRGIIDQRRSEGFRFGQFLILGSASLDLLNQSSETLAGRIAFTELSGFTVPEIGQLNLAGHDSLWLRGGFPDSFMAKNDTASLRWRLNFISTYLERDVPQLGSRIPATGLRSLWTMLAYAQGSQLNTSQLGANLGLSAPTAKRYIQLLEDLLLIRTLRPWSGNIGKRLVKTPKVYIRDSGLTHALLHLTSIDDLLGHPVVGTSWEGFVIENLLSCLPIGLTAWFYRTIAGAEIDLVIEKNPQEKMAIEIKRAMAPKVSKGFHIGCEDLKINERYIVYPGQERYPTSDNAIVLSLSEMMLELGRIK